MKSTQELHEAWASNRSYCRRLSELTFPEKIWVRGTAFEPQQLRQELETAISRGDRSLLRLLARRFFLHPETISVNELIEKIFPETREFLGKSYTAGTLYGKLLDSPKLQHAVAVTTHFTPSKWLLEQEMQARPDCQTNGEDIYKSVGRRGLMGVCFSGGGIRSATFNLGIAQGLAQLGLLPYVDYLSSVSGGGYIHQFLAAWILRHPRGLSGVAEELVPQAEPGCLPRAPEPIKWLKRYASYLTPVRGIFATDTWTMIAIWFRNTVLNQVPIVAVFGFVFLMVHLLAPAPEWSPASFWALRGTSLAIGELTAVAVAAWSLWQLARNLKLQRAMRKSSKAAEFRETRLLSNVDVQLRIMLPWLALSVWTICWLRMLESHWAHRADAAVFVLWVMAMTMLVIFAGGATDSFRNLHTRAGKTTRILTGVSFGVLGLISTSIACLIGLGIAHGGRAVSVALSNALSLPAMHIDPWRIELVFLPGLLLSVPYAAIELSMGLLGRDYKDIQREWLARLRAWALLYAVVWSGVTGLALLGPYVGYWVCHWSAGLKYPAVAAFVAAHLTTILTGWSGKSDGKPTEKGIFGLKPMDLAAMIAAPITILGLLLTVSSLTAWGVDSLYANLGRISNLLPWLFTPTMPYWKADLLLAVLLLAIAALFGWRVDINEFSMQLFYRNRLTRCYLGATTPNREPDPFTGFDRRGELFGVTNPRAVKLPPSVSDLLPDKFNKEKIPGRYDGPFPIFCTTLNLTTGEDLATQERKGTSFAFTPLYSGYSVSWTDGKARKKVSYNGYVPTRSYAYPHGGIHLDTAVAISGAAVNPSMGYNSNPILAFLMTFFNVRLGWWITNTRRIDAWRASNDRVTPRFALACLLKELFGMVNDGSSFVNLSDGGHFENMGLYELVRRRCRYIVVCDAEEDPDQSFGGMGGAITKCRADFGAEIDLDLRPLRLDDKTGYSQTHCVVGTIRYPPPPEDREERVEDSGTECDCMEDGAGDCYTGVIVYLKSSLVGDEPPDLLTYKLAHPSFPQDSTMNQWFTETQFEAYRRLGHHVAMTSLQPALAPGQPSFTTEGGRDTLPQLFRRMHAIWYPRTPEMEAHLSEHLKLHDGIRKELRDRAELAGLEELLSDPSSGTEERKWITAHLEQGQRVYGEQFATALLDFMVTVYINLKLAFPDNRTSPHAEWWICLFRRWCRVDIVRQAWKTHAVGFPLEFQLFAQRELRLTAPESIPSPAISISPQE